MGATNNRKKKLKRQRLFLKQNGKCVWCNRRMSLDFSNPEEPTLATFEHLNSKLSGLRELKKQVIVLACRECNNNRGKKEAEVNSYRVSLIAKATYRKLLNNTAIVVYETGTVCYKCGLRKSELNNGDNRRKCGIYNYKKHRWNTFPVLEGAHSVIKVPENLLE